MTNNINTDIVVITPTYGLSGVPLAQCRLARALAEENSKVTLIIGNNSSRFQLPHIPNTVIRVLNKRRVIFMIIPIIRLFIFSRPKLVFSAEDHLNIIILICALITNNTAKICCSSRVTPYDTYSNKLLTKKWFLKCLYRLFSFRADVLSCVSKDMVYQYKKIFPKTTHIPIYNIVVDSYSTSLCQEKVDHPWLKDKKLPVIIAAGMLEPWKDFETLIYAFSDLVKTKSAYLIILGEGSLMSKLVDLSVKLSVSQFIDFPGYRSNPLSYFSRSDVFALSSRVEGMPNVLIEAMYCGCTPVSTNCPTGPSEVIMDDQYGYLCSVGDSQSMSKKLLKALECPIPTKVLRKGTLKFTKEHVLNRYSSLLSEKLIH